MAKAPKMPKLPKSLGACVDLYHEAKQARLAKEKELEPLLADFKAKEKFILDHIIDNLPKGDGGAVGKAYKAVRTEKANFSIEDDAAFYEFIRKNNAFDLLNRAINQKAVAERLQDPKFTKKYPKGVPGTKKFTVIGLSVTKL